MIPAAKETFFGSFFIFRVTFSIFQTTYISGFVSNYVFFHVLFSNRGVVSMGEDFLNIYDQYFNDVYRYVYVKTGNKWDAEDIVSEIFR